MMVMQAGATTGHIRRDHVLMDDFVNGLLQNSGAGAPRERRRL
jgi:hypothetical protein